MRKLKFVVGEIYHIFNRGAEKRDIFLSDSDRWRFLQGMYLFNDEKSSANLLFRLERDKGGANFKTLKEFISNRQEERKQLVKIMVDTLMPNHFHFILEEIEEGGISRFMQKFCTGFTMFFNKKYDHAGSLFQGPFKAVHVDNELYLQYLLVYLNVINPGQLIEPNLKEEGPKDINEILKFAEEYSWSTHKEYAGLRNSIIINKGILGGIFDAPEKYIEFAKAVLQDKKYELIDNLTFE